MPTPSATLYAEQLTAQAEIKTKVCTKCRTLKLVSEFSKRRRNPDGLDGWCKSCNVANVNKSYRRKAEKFADKSAAELRTIASASSPTKVCTKSDCSLHGAPQSLDNFYKSSSQTDGLSCWCKTCQRESSKKRGEQLSKRHIEFSESDLLSITKVCACSTCKQTSTPQPLINFYKDMRRRDGFDSKCKACRLKQGRDNRKNHKERIQKNLSERKAVYLANPDNRKSEKVCSRATCVHRGTPQPVANFGKRGDVIDGLQSACKDCLSAKRHEWYLRNKDHEAKRVKVWYEKNKDREVQKRKDYYGANRDILRSKETKRRRDNWASMRVWQCKQRAKAKGIPFNLEECDLLPLPEYCSVFGVKLDYQVGPDRRLYASIDRIKPELGYVKGNVRIISFAANTAKLDGIGDLITKRRSKQKQLDIPRQSLFS